MFRFWFPWKHPGGIEWPEMGSMMSVTSFWLTLNRFYRFFWCFHCWLWTSKYRLAYFRFLVRVGKKLKLGTLKILVKNIRRHSNKSTEISSNLCQSIDQYTVMSSVKIIKRVFTCEISSRDELIPVHGEMSLTVYTFLPRLNFILGWKKTKRRVNNSSRDEILKWACFLNFWRMYSSLFSKFNMFEHNESLNIIKHKASL